MKVSELIAELQNFADRYGDLTVIDQAFNREVLDVTYDPGDQFDDPEDNEDQPAIILVT